MNISDIEEKIKMILVDKLFPKLIYVFGSTNQNRVRDDSDIDIAILTDQDIDEYKLYLISQQLADVLKREVDLIDLKKVSTVFKAEVFKTGRLIYHSDNLVKMNFQLGILQEYVFLNERRKEVIYKLKSRNQKGAKV